MRSFRLPLACVATAALAASLAACTAKDAITTTLAAVDRAAVVERNTARLREATGSARVLGQAIGPAGVVGANIVASNSGRLISNNGGAIVASNSGRIVASNSGRYATLAVSQRPIANAIVYLTDPDERFYALDGQPLTATTDDKGRYDFLGGVPTGEVVIVNVILADNRREVGFTVSKGGKNVVDVSLATTYVTEFLRDRAARLGKTMADYDLAALSKLTRLTETAIAQGDLPVPDLAIGKIGEMNQAYALAVGLNKQKLGDAWADVLGGRVLAVTTVAGNGESGLGGNGKAATQAQLYKPKSVVKDADGNLYIADEGNHMVRKVDAEGVISTLAGKGVPQFSGDGGPGKDAGLWWPRALAIAPGGALYVGDTLNMRIRRVNLVDGSITTVAGAPAQANGSFLNDFAGDGGPALQAKFAGLRGFAVDSRGGLVFADTWDNDGGSWHHIRRMDRDGVVTSLVGVDGKHGFNGDFRKGRETEINYVNQVAVDGQDNVYFADARNHRVRKYDARTEIVTTVAGDGSEGTNGDGGAATSAQLSSPYGVTVDKSGRVFIAERGSRRIRVVLKDGTIRTIAGGGSYTGDGEARSLAFSEPHELTLEADGNLLFCDSRAAKVRRLWLQWGM